MPQVGGAMTQGVSGDEYTQLGPSAPAAEDQTVETEQPFDVVENIQQPATPTYQRSGPMVNETITRKTVLTRPLNEVQRDYQPAPRYSPPQLPQPVSNNRVVYRENDRTKTARELLDELMIRPDTTEWKLQVYRWHPAEYDGNPVPRGKVLECDIMPFDGLRCEIERTWGGGNYRVVITNERKEAVSGIQAMQIEVPVEQCPPRLRKGEQTEQEQAALSRINGPQQVRPLTPEEEEIRSADRHAKLALARARQNEAEMKDVRSKLQMQMEYNQLMKLQREVMTGGGGEEKKENEQIAILRDEMRKRDEQFKLERENFERQLLELRHQKELERRDQQPQQMQHQIKMLQNGGGKNPEVEMLREEMRKERDASEKRISELLAKLDGLKADPGKDMREVVTAMLPALTQKDNSGVQHIAEVMRAGQESMRQSMEMMAKFGQKDNTAQANLVNSLIQTVMQMKQGENSPDLFLKLVKFGREQVKDAMDLAQAMNGGNGGDEGADAESGDGWDPKAGFLGNIGKALYAGFKGLVGAAQQNPQLLEVLVKLIGNRNPTDAEMVAAAHRMEMQQAGMLGMNPAGGARGQLLPHQQAMAQQQQAQRLTPAQQQQLLQRQQQMRMAQGQVVQPQGRVIQAPPAQLIPANPQQQVSRQAQQQGMGMPPPLTYRQRPQAPQHQGPLVTPPPAPVIRPQPPVATPQVAIPVQTPVAPVEPAPQPTVEAQTQEQAKPETPVEAASAATVVPPQDEPQAEQPQEPTQEAANDIASAMLGIDVVETPGAWQSNEQVAVVSEPVESPIAPVEAEAAPQAVVAQAEPVQPPTPPAAPATGSSGGETDARLRYYVTESMKMAIDDIQDQRNTHVWPNDAFEYWGNRFIRQLAAINDDTERYTLIGSKCDPEVWGKLMRALEADPGEGFPKLFDGIRAVVAQLEEARA